MSSVSAIFGVRISTVSPHLPLRQPPHGGSTAVAPPSLHYGGSNGGLTIECSSRPQKKATAHHRKTRPKKTQPWDKNRGPTVYPPLPELPPEWSFAPDETPSPTPPASQ